MTTIFKNCGPRSDDFLGKALYALESMLALTPVYWIDNDGSFYYSATYVPTADTLSFFVNDVASEEKKFNPETVLANIKKYKQESKLPDIPISVLFYTKTNSLVFDYTNGIIIDWSMISFLPPKHIRNQIIFHVKNQTTYQHALCRLYYLTAGDDTVLALASLTEDLYMIDRIPVTNLGNSLVRHIACSFYELDKPPVKHYNDCVCPLVDPLALSNEMKDKKYDSLHKIAIAEQTKIEKRAKSKPNPETNALEQLDLLGEAHMAELRVVDAKEDFLIEDLMSTPIKISSNKGLHYIVGVEKYFSDVTSCYIVDGKLHFVIPANKPVSYSMLAESLGIPVDLIVITAPFEEKDDESVDEDSRRGEWY